MGESTAVDLLQILPLCCNSVHVGEGESVQLTS